MNRKWFVYLYASYLNGQAPFYADDNINASKRYFKRFLTGDKLIPKEK